MTEHKFFVFRFGDIRVSEREFLLIKAGKAVAVEPKAFRVLLFLLRNPGRLVSKDEILSAVWNDCSVSDNSLTRSITTLRRLLGDDTREPRYIATVPTVGYRFLCEVEAEEESFGGLDSADRRHPDRGNGFESYRGTHGVEGSPKNPQVQAAVTEEVEQPSDEGRSQTRRLLPGLVAAAAVILVTGFLFHRAVSSRDALGHAVQSASATAKSTRMHIVPLTNLPGRVDDPAFSPDGEKIAFIWDGENRLKGDLYVQLVGGERPLRLTHTTSGYICCADWSPDGREIVFGRCDDKGGGIFTVPALGGLERKLTDVTCPFGDAGYPKWTGDGRSLLLADRCVPDRPRGLVVFSLETGEKRCLTVPPADSDVGDVGQVLSPDGKTVAFTRSTTAAKFEIFTIPLSGGNAQQITHEETGAWLPMWSSDGQHIIFHSTRRVLRIPATGGAIEPETAYPKTGALSRDGRRVAYVEGSGFVGGRALGIWRIGLSRAGGHVVSQKKILATDGGNADAQPSPNGRQIVFKSARSRNIEIWKSEADGSNPLQLTFLDKGCSGTPRWSPDGRWIAFGYQPLNHGQIYLIDSEGRNLHAVTSGNYENMAPGWSRDGTAVYFASYRTGSWQVWKHEIATGREVQVTQHGGYAAFESYDAKTVYYSRLEGGGIWSVPVGGGDEHQVTDALHRGYWGYFAVTDTGIYLVDSEAMPKPTMMFYNFQTKLLTPVHQLEEDPVGWIANLAASRDGRTVWFGQGNWPSSIMMAENIQ